MGGIIAGIIAGYENIASDIRAENWIFLDISTRIEFSTWIFFSFGAERPEYPLS